MTGQQYQLESHAIEESTEQYPRGNQAVSPEIATAARFHSGSAPYLARRSSFGQTPGAATRLLSPEPQFPTRASFRKSLPPASNGIDHVHPRAMMSRRQSMPVYSRTTEERIRAATPSEGEYRQLGGMKFGSLRITNDASAPTDEDAPARHNADQWPITSDFAGDEQPKQPNSTASVGKDAMKLASETNSDYNAALFQPELDDSNASRQATHQAADSAEARDAVSSEAQETRAYSSDTSNSSENRSSDEQDQERQLSVPSNLDSGYASNNSLDSSSDPKSADRSSGDSQANDGPPQSLTGQDKSSGPHADSVDDHELSQEDGGAAYPGQVAEVQRQHSLRARGSAMLSSFLSRKSRESRSMESNTPRSRASSTHSRGASLPDAPTHDEDTIEGSSSPQKQDDHSGQPNKLKRLLRSRRRSLPHDSTYIVQDTTPMPFDAEDKLREHGFKIIHTPAEKPPLRMEQSRDTLKTIISVGSGEDENNTEDTRPSKQDKRRSYERQRTGSHQSTNRPSNISRTKSLLYPKPSSRQAKATLRKSMPMIIKPSTTKVDPVDEDLAETVQIWGYEAHMASIASIRHMAGNSAFDQAFVPMSRDNGAYPAPVNAPPPPQERPMHNSRPGWTHQPLRTRYSAPDFLETVCEPASPGGIDSTQQKPPKTPPPVSLRTRGSKKSRRRARSQHHSYRPYPHYVPPVPPIDMQDLASETDNDMPSPRRLSQSLRSFPVQPPQGPPQGPNHGYGGYSTMQDQMHFSKPRNNAHHRGSWHGPPPPGHIRPHDPRAQHGYNSPAHRGPPIQSSY